MKYMVCNRCVIDSTIPGVEFYKDGTCSYCREYKKRENKLLRKKKEFNKIIELIKKKGKGKKYDALIGLSGGLDSTFSAYVAVKSGLRLLGVHVDNGWNDKVAIDNIKAVANNFGIDLIIESPAWEQFRDLQLAFLRASVVNIEIPTDHIITATLYYKANEHDLKYIINGGNLISEGVSIPEAFGHFNRDFKYLNDIHKRFGTIDIKDLQVIGIPRTLYYRYIKRIRIIRILDFVDYNLEYAKTILNQEIAWKPYSGKHNESIFTRFYQNYILPNKFGIDKRRIHLAALVCSGQLERGKALSLLERPHYTSVEILERDKEFVISKLNITKEEFEEIMNQPRRNDNEFASHKWIFEFARFLSRKGIRLGE